MRHTCGYDLFIVLLLHTALEASFTYLIKIFPFLSLPSSAASDTTTFWSALATTGSVRTFFKDC